MSKLAERFVEFAIENGCTKEEFEEAIDYLYSSIVDMMLDNNPGIERKHSQTFDGHKLIVTSRREFFN